MVFSTNLHTPAPLRSSSGRQLLAKTGATRRSFSYNVAQANNSLQKSACRCAGGEELGRAIALIFGADTLEIDRTVLNCSIHWGTIAQLRGGGALGVETERRRHASCNSCCKLQRLIGGLSSACCGSCRSPHCHNPCRHTHVDTCVFLTPPPHTCAACSSGRRTERRGCRPCKQHIHIWT